jgi:hypothetical protein
VTALALIVAVLSAPTIGLASRAPDGYETAVASANVAGSPLGHLESAQHAGQFNATAQAWQDSLVGLFPGSYTARALLSTLVAAAAASGLALACTRRRKSLIA